MQSNPENSETSFENKSPTAKQIRLTPFFENPLIPVSEPSKEQNKELLIALDLFRKRKTFDDISALDEFVKNHADSPWCGSIYLSIGRENFLVGKFSKALKAFASAWEYLKTADEFDARQIADRAFGELVKMEARLGRFEQLEKLFPQFEGRHLIGSNTELISSAKSGHMLMNYEPEVAFRCGSSAVSNILNSLNPNHSFGELFYETKSSKKGMSLQFLFELSEKAGLKYQIAKRRTNAEILFPCVAHYKLNHYCAITQENDGLYKIEDATFGVNFSVWVSSETIEEEMSGYFLVPEGALPKGWEVVSAEEANDVWGKGATETSDPNATSPCDEKAKEECGQQGMATYNMHLMLVSLNIQDSPLGYTPNRGTPINIELTYNQKEAGQPSGFNHFNVGHKWTINWLTYIIDNGINPTTGNANPGDVKLFVAGGGTYTFKQSGAGTFFPELYTQANLVRTSANSYTMTMPDGSKKIFEQVQSSTMGNVRKIFLSRISNTNVRGYDDVLLEYDSTSPGAKLEAIRDALGNRTTFAYGTSNPYLITKITDPYNRSCSLNYNANNQLTQITDVIGLTSQFTYGRTLQYLIVPHLMPVPFITIVNNDFIEKMTTPYGETMFSYSEPVPSLNGIGSWSGYWNRQYTLSVIGPDGGREVVEYYHDFTGLFSSSGREAEAPSGWDNNFTNFRNTFYWDKKAMQSNPARDYRFAKVYHFLHANYTTTSGILESIKKPLESRIWFTYPNQGNDTKFLGASASKKPNKVSRIVDSDNALGNDTQSYLYNYNSYGLITKKTDPLERITHYTYDSNGLNLLQIKQSLGGSLTCEINNFEYTDLRFPSKPTKILDASRQATTFMYSFYGQLETITNAKNETTRFHYDNILYLTEIELPLSGTTNRIRFEYDVVNGKRMNRISSVTDTEGFRTEFEYDNFDRVTKIKYPDSTFESYEYTNLDLTKATDRSGHSKQYYYNNIRQLVRLIGGATIVGRAQEDINYDWCMCGKLRMISFGPARLDRTEFFHDIQGRLTEKLYENHRLETYEYYGRTSLLKNKIQHGTGHNQVTNYTYFKDNNIKTVSYFDSTVVATRQPIMHPVTFEYDSFFDRINKVIDELVTTTYYYLPVLPLIKGALKLQCIKSVLSTAIVPYSFDPQIDFEYDELGRETKRILNTTGTIDPLNSGHHSAGIGMLTSTFALPYTQQVTYDAIGRITNKDNITGSHVFSYLGLSNRHSQIAHTGHANFKTQFDWHSLIPNLKSITNINGTEVLSKNEYEYNNLSDITKWEQTKQKKFSSYLATKDIIDIEYDTLGQLVKENRMNNKGHHFISENEYDNYGNRVSVTNSEYSSLTGTLNPPVKGTASYIRDNQIDRIVPDITQPANELLFNHDDYGQVRSLQHKKEYEWDAAGRIKKITHWDEAPGNRPENTTEFFYDAFNRIIKINEKKYNEPVKEVFFIWCFNELCAQLIRGKDIRYYTQEGFVDVVPGSSATNVRHSKHTFLYSKDQLGSICEVVGNGLASTLRYNYDRWGVRTSEVVIKPRKAFTPESVPFGFCGYFYHERSGMYLTKYRAYKPEIGRWLSRDPIGEEGGLNLYGYCANNPVNRIDQFGLSWKNKLLVLISTLELLFNKGKSRVGGEMLRKAKQEEVMRQLRKSKSKIPSGGTPPPPLDDVLPCTTGIGYPSLEHIFDIDQSGTLDEDDLIEFFNPDPFFSWREIQLMANPKPFDPWERI